MGIVLKPINHYKLNFFILFHISYYILYLSPQITIPSIRGRGMATLKLTSSPGSSPLSKIPPAILKSGEDPEDEVALK